MRLGVVVAVFAAHAAGAGEWSSSAIVRVDAAVGETTKELQTAEPVADLDVTATFASGWCFTAAARARADT